MAREIPLFDQSFECHKDIARLVVARIKPEITVSFVCSKKTGRDGQNLAYVLITPLHSKVPGVDKRPVENTIGIPETALVPEKVAPIAYWLVKEFKKQRPDLFQIGEVTVV